MAAAKEKLVQRAKIAQQAERYNDMAAAMKSITETAVELSKEERTLFSVAYKKLIDSKRSSWRMISSIEQEKEGPETKRQMAKEYKEELQNEIKDTCCEVTGLLDKFLIPNASNKESMVFYFKMKGDYYRYLSESANLVLRGAVVDDSQKAYQEALNIAKQNLQPLHPLRLEIALNFSLFYYQVVFSTKRACELAKQALHEAKAGQKRKRKSAKEEPCKESTHIMKLLRENLALWSSDIITSEEESGSDDSDIDNEYDDVKFEYARTARTKQTAKRFTN